MGSSGLEPPTSRLSGARSNRLSYEPIFPQPPTLPGRSQPSTIGRLSLHRRVRNGYGCFSQAHHHQPAPRVGLEPTTLRLTAGCSTIELSRKTVRSLSESRSKSELCKFLASLETYDLSYSSGFLSSSVFVNLQNYISNLMIR